MGRHSRPEPPPSRRSPDTSTRSAPQGRRRRAIDDEHPSGPLPQFSDYPESVSFPDDLSDLDAPTRRNPSGEDISGLTGTDGTESGYFDGAGYFSDFGGYTDLGESREDLREDPDVRVLAGLGYDLGNPDDVESFDGVGGIEELEAPTTKTSPDDLDVPTTKTSSEPELEAPTTKTSFGRKRRRRREAELDVPEDLDAPTRKHTPGPKRRRAEPTEDELRRKRRRSAEKAGRRAAAAESAPAPEEDVASDEDVAAAPRAASSRAASSRAASSREVPPERPSETSAEIAKRSADARPGPWSKYATSKRSESSRSEPKPRTEPDDESDDTTSRSAGQPSETGYHRAVSTRRGIAKWPIAVAAVLALLALGGLGAVWANKALNAQAEAEANSCTEGTSTLRVTTTPTIEDDVAAAAKNWNDKKPPVYSHCVTITVTAAASDKVLPTLREADAKTVPAAWITPSAEWAEKLAKTNPERVSSTAKPLKNASGTYYTYVVVGGEGVDEIQQRAAQQFRDYVREAVAQ
ncbi:MAG: hypothetical protein GEU97_09640 [Actinophytocola sp.]|nr:hypothetical protein [Actinophytocola sp.]